MLPFAGNTTITQVCCQLHISTHLCYSNIPRAAMRGDDGEGWCVNRDIGSSSNS